MWWMVLYILFGLIIGIAAALTYGSYRWRSAVKKIRLGLEGARIPIGPKRYDERELQNLPLPVQLYFQTVLKAGQPLITAVSIEQTGTFNMSDKEEQWKPFVATQQVVASRPGFVWEARISLAPLITVKVHDAYVSGEGILHASLFGLVTLARLRGTPEADQGELMRFLAEAAWFPTALLPSQGVRWEAVDEMSAKAFVTDGETTVSVVFHFNKDNLIEAVSAVRPRTVGQGLVPTKWEGRWSNYGIRDGMRVPLEGEVAWILPQGRQTYWRGCITNLRYRFMH